jgi:hypothetical protein
MVYSGAWGKLIHEKNQKQKSRDTVPLNVSTHYDRIQVCKIIKLHEKGEAMHKG